MRIVKEAFHWKTLTILIGIPLLGLFQNCSKVTFKELSAEGLGAAQGVSSDQGVQPGARIKSIEETILITNQSQVDVLFIVDNSGSMREEQQGLSEKISGFMNLIQNLEWQVALTTTDPRVPMDGQAQDGAFLSFRDSQNSKILKKGTHEIRDAQDLLAQAILVGVAGSGDERGIQVARRSVERREESSIHREFYRKEAVLMIVLISDEDECSNGRCLQDDSLNHPREVLKYFTEQFGNQKVIKFNSIIRSPTDSTCTTAANVGHYYSELSRLTSGVVGSICAQNYTQILESLGHKTLELMKSINLRCDPVDRDKDGLVDFEMEDIAGVKIVGGYKLEGRTLIFEQGLADGSYILNYYCAD